MLQKLIKSKSSGGVLKVCDIGAGKGRYLKNLIRNLPNNDYYATDISEKVMSDIEGVKEKRVASITMLPFENNYFDIVYACESFEHSLNLQTAFKEMYRIVRSDGLIVILDKPVDKLGALELYEWEQWINDSDIIKFAKECGGTVKIESNIPYEGKNDGLFRAWIIRKR